MSSGNNGSSNRPLYGGEEGYNKLTANQKANSLRIQPGDVKWKDVNGDGIIDNFSAGGISALIDPETGCICSDGADKKGRRYAAHPDTGVRFNGYRLPEWDKAVAMVTTAAHMVPGNHYCGWDLAYSTHGWCMVEANCTAQMGGMQIITQTGRKAELEALIAQM